MSGKGNNRKTQAKPRTTCTCVLSHKKFLFIKPNQESEVQPYLRKLHLGDSESSEPEWQNTLTSVHSKPHLVWNNMKYLTYWRMDIGYNK